MDATTNETSATAGMLRPLADRVVARSLGRRHLLRSAGALAIPTLLTAITTGVARAESINTTRSNIKGSSVANGGDGGPGGDGGDIAVSTGDMAWDGDGDVSWTIESGAGGNGGNGGDAISGDADGGSGDGDMNAVSPREKPSSAEGASQARTAAKGASKGKKRRQKRR